MYYLIRLAVIALLMFIGIRILIKKRSRWLTYKKIVITNILLLFILVCIPIEVNILSFGTPAQAFRYTNLTGHIQQVLEGERSAIILSGRDPSKLRYAYSNKVNGRWRIETPFDQFKISTAIFHVDDATITRRINKVENEYYFMFFPRPFKASLQIKDSLGSSFQFFELLDLGTGQKSPFYYTIIDGAKITDDYQLIVNGKSVDWNKPV